MLIRLFRTDDPEYPEVLNLRNRVLRKPLGMDIRNDDLSDEAQCRFLACFTDEGKMLGCLKIKQLDDGAYQFMQMAVDQDYQGKGIGSVLLKEAEGLVREWGGESVVLDSRGYAIPFYEKNGYQANGEFFEKINIPHQRMIKTL